MMSVQTIDLGQLASVRVTGLLTADAQLAETTGAEPHTLLTLQLQPPTGLPYLARVDLGPDVAERMLAEAELPYLRRGALVSVAGQSLELRTDHSHAVLKVVGARDVFIPLNHGAASC